MSKLLPRYTEQTPIQRIDPLEAEIIRIEHERKAAIEAVNQGKHTDADPQDLRGIPCIARGVGGVSPGTDPFAEASRRTYNENQQPG